MLTVRYDWLGVQTGDLLLDLGCGFGRNAFEAARQRRPRDDVCFLATRRDMALRRSVARDTPCSRPPWPED